MQIKKPPSPPFPKTPPLEGGCLRSRRKGGKSLPIGEGVKTEDFDG